MQGSSAVNNYLHVGHLLEELETLYNQALQVCKGHENKLNIKRSITIYTPGSFDVRLSETRPSISQTRPATYLEIMDLIRIFFKLVSGGELTKEENFSAEVNNIYKMIDWRYMGHYIEREIKWLTNMIQKCTNI